MRRIQFGQLHIRSTRTGKVAGVFEGYANKFGALDDYGTRWKAGAWSRGGLDADPYPLLWMHDPWNPIGTVRVNEDKTGLHVEGSWDDSEDGKRARIRAESSAPELSVGFKTLEKDPRDKNLITSSLLREVSQVTLRFGSSPDAEIAAVRSLATRAGERTIWVVRPKLSLERRRALALLELAR